MECVLCQSSQPAFFQVIKKPERNYYHCPDCDVIFMSPEQRLSLHEEKARYDLHQNDGQEGHQAFLAPLVEDVLTSLTQQGRDLQSVQVLDFGCGPLPALAVMFAHRGVSVTNYDIFYRPDQDSLRRNYHAITSTEVWEHLAQPREEISRLVRMLRNDGILAVMTSSHKGEAAFHDWHYRRDTTHVVFYSEKTMLWIARKFNLSLLKAKSPYWIFKK